MEKEQIPSLIGFFKIQDRNHEVLHPHGNNLFINPQEDWKKGYKVGFFSTWCFLSFFLEMRDMWDANRRNRDGLSSPFKRATSTIFLDLLHFNL
jgi:hypothetical protein